MYNQSISLTRDYLKGEYANTLYDFIDSGPSDEKLEQYILQLSQQFVQELQDMFPEVDQDYFWTPKEVRKIFTYWKKSYQKQKHKEETGNLQYVLDVNGNKTERQQMIYTPA